MISETLDQDLVDKVITEISQVLQRSEGEVRIETKLIKDLGIESIEVLELAFVLETQFDTKIGESDLWNLGGYVAANNLFSDGKFSDEAKGLIEAQITALRDGTLETLSSPQQIPQYLCVRDIVNFIQARRNH